MRMFLVDYLVLHLEIVMMKNKMIVISLERKNPDICLYKLLHSFLRLQSH